MRRVVAVFAGSLVAGAAAAQLLSPLSGAGQCPLNQVVVGLNPQAGPTCDPIVLDGGGIDLLGPVGSSPNANAGTISGNTLNLQPGSGAQPGIVTAGTQTLGGNKTWLGDAGFADNVQVAQVLSTTDNGQAYCAGLLNSSGAEFARDICMVSDGGAQISFFNTSYDGGSQGYNIFENNFGVLEFNSLNRDGSNPQSECSMTFSAVNPAGNNGLQCVGTIESQMSTQYDVVLRDFDSTAPANFKRYTQGVDNGNAGHKYVFAGETSAGAALPYAIVNRSADGSAVINLQVAPMSGQELLVGGFSSQSGTSVTGVISNHSVGTLRLLQTDDPVANTHLDIGNSTLGAVLVDDSLDVTAFKMQTSTAATARTVLENRSGSCLRTCPEMQTQVPPGTNVLNVDTTGATVTGSFAVTGAATIGGVSATAVPEVTLASLELNSLIPGSQTTEGGHVIRHNFTVTQFTGYVITAGSACSGNLTFAATDGTNTCSGTLGATVASDTVFSLTSLTGTCALTTGSPSLRFNLTGGTCSTQPTLKNWDIVGHY